MRAFEDGAMMTQQLQTCIVTAPFVQVDRGALSQAWYSALHLARRRALQALPPAHPKSLPAPARRAALAVAERLRGDRAVASASSPRRSTPQRSRALLSPNDRRALPASLARRIARAFFAPRSLPMRSTLTLGRGEGRVHVILQNSGGRMRLIAICRPADREVVIRALAQARLELIACS